ncbi:hypothetical protein [Gemella morbillorum]
MKMLQYIVLNIVLTTNMYIEIQLQADDRTFGFKHIFDTYFYPYFRI